MNIFLIISSIFFTTLAVGFFVGFFRGWCKSLIRLGITFINFLLAIFITPTITNIFTSKITNGSEISIFNFSFNISEIFKDIIGDDISISQSTTNLLVTTIANIIANLILFFAIFLVLQIFTLIIYWIVLMVLKFKNKEEKNSQNIGQRCLGGLQGLIGSLILIFVFMIPLFGSMNILDKTIEDSAGDNQISEASAISVSNSFLCGELYYNSEEIEEINSYIDRYKLIKKQYNSTLMGIMLKYTGINKLGTLSFNHLTNVNIMNENISFTNEISSLIETFNSSKVLLSDKIDLTSNEFFSNVNFVYKKATQSIFVQRYLTDLIPAWADKWSNNEKFFNIENPIPEEYHETVNHMLKAIASIQNFSRLDRNIETLFETISILNDHNIISQISNGQDLITILSNDKTIVKQVLFKLSSTGELRNNLPNTLNSSLSILYDIIVADDKFTPYISDSIIEDLDWDIETDTIQNIVNEFLNTYDLYINSESSKAESLSSLGKSIDFSRNSKILSTSLKSFMIGFIESDVTDIDQLTKENLVLLINEKWDIEENPDYSFEQSFSLLANTEKLINSITNNINASTPEDIGTIDKSNISNSIKNIISDDVSRKLYLDILKNNDIISSYIELNKISNSIIEIFTPFIENTTSETIDNDLIAFSSLIDIVSINNNFTELSLDECDKLINSISNSKCVMNILSNSNETSSLSILLTNIGQKNLKVLSESIENAQISENQKTIFNKFFKV